MSLPATYLFSFPPTNDSLPVSHPSPPVSTGAEIDFDAFSDLEFENTFGLSPSSSSAPSTNLVSPKSSLNDFSLVDADNDLNKESPSNLNTAEALSAHHLQRYLHYKALAEQAEQQARLMTEQLESLFAYNMPLDNTPANFNYGNGINMAKVPSSSMLAFQPQPMAMQLPQQQMYSPMEQWQPAPVPVQSSANLHAQANAHMQAHQAAQGSMTMSGAQFFMAPQVDSRASWSAQSASSVASASVPTTPAGPMAVPMTTSVTAPAMSRVASSEGEMELDRLSVVSEEDLKPHLPTDIPLTNLNGGGRGYVPGQTPDDPKKRHKCGVCGRSFARAFNLKSHVQTHNPLRSKPHTCPHSSCRRGFSRLHDLERHRQGIHSDGPLVEAKTHNVAPSVARAKDRIQKRAETGSLI